MHPAFALAVLKLALKLDVGPEYDTNANRAEVYASALYPNPDHPTASALFRTDVRLQLAWRDGKNLLTASGLLGAKIFFNSDVFDQDVLAGQIGVDDRYQFGALQLGLSGDYYDAGQLEATAPAACTHETCDRRRDFRSGQVLARAVVSGRRGAFELSAGYRGFQYKSDESYDFHAPQLNAIFGTRFTSGADDQHEWDLNLSYHFEQRFFDSPRSFLLSIPSCQFAATFDSLTCLGSGDNRMDSFHEVAIEGTYVGPVLLQLGYFVQLTDSNSYQYSLLRQGITLKFGARLFWGLYATLKAQLLVTGYLDPITIGQRIVSGTLVSIDDENRNAVIVDVERAIGKSGVSIDARYAVYTNELDSTPSTFLRQTIYLGMTYRYSYVRR